MITGTRESEREGGTPPPFPAYSYVPGHRPHPRKPGGHSFGEPEPHASAIAPERWRESPLYAEGLRRFAAGFYWEAHEAFEALWHAAGRVGEVADLLRALVKLCAAGVKVREGMPRGVRSHGERAAGHVRAVRASLAERGACDRTLLGLDLAALERYGADIAARCESLRGDPALTVEVVLPPLPMARADDVRAPAENAPAGTGAARSLDGATLYAFGGLPGVGKSTLAQGLARELGATYVRVDSIEQGLREAGGTLSGPEGYVIAYRVASDNLALGRSVVADTVNPIAATRESWRQVAAAAGVPCLEIEVHCGDAAEHRARVEGRAGTVPGLRLPSWEDVVARGYEPWPTASLRIDTAGRTIDECMADLRERLVRETLRRSGHLG